MIGVYFSGTGNTKYCVESFVTACDTKAKSYAIEDIRAIEQIHNHDEIVFGYSVQYSNIPKFVKDFINENALLWKNKRIFVIATMGLFSGDGAGVLARLLKKHGASITGGLHVRMPDSICDEKVLKGTFDKNKQLVSNAKKILDNAAIQYKNGHPSKQGLHFFSRLLGFFGQRLYFINKTNHYTDSLKIDTNKCIGCNKCVKLCPIKNISIKNGKAVAGNMCTMCYRCVNQCPTCAITLLGNKVSQQTIIEKYL